MEIVEKYALYKSILGVIRIGCYKNMITSISFACDNDIEESNPCDITDLAYTQLQEYFEGKRRKFDLPLYMIGTEFQKRVWNELCNIPYGQTCSYKQIAIKIGNSKASRAVGLANNKNPIAIVVPCHRVIGSNGKLVGYAGGLDKKIALLNIEKGMI